MGGGVQYGEKDIKAIAQHVGTRSTTQVGGCGWVGGMGWEGLGERWDVREGWRGGMERMKGMKGTEGRDELGRQG